MQRFDLARNALRYIILTYGIKEIHIPYYLCDVIRHVVFEENCKIRFYHINDDFMPNQTFSLDDYILYPNYFGVCSKNVDILEKIYPKLIVDNAHALYFRQAGFASFNSSRKFLLEDKGAYLLFKDDINEFEPDLERRARFLDYEEKYGLTNQLRLNIKKDDIPFCYPYLAKTVKEADELVKNLECEGKVIYRYWNNLPESFNEYKFYSRLVPIPL